MGNHKMQWFVAFAVAVVVLRGDDGVSRANTNVSEDGLVRAAQIEGPGADYAEYLPLLHADEVVEPGDVVGVYSGWISRRTDGADQVMVVSTAPIVTGNRTDAQRADAERYKRVAFIGQTPVKARGPVKSGDLLIPSGLDDGTAVSVPPRRVTARLLRTVFATAWEEKMDNGVGLVRSAVGVDQAAAAAEVIADLHSETERQSREIDRLKREMESLERMLRETQDDLREATSRLDRDIDSAERSCGDDLRRAISNVERQLSSLRSDIDCLQRRD